MSEGMNAKPATAPAATKKTIRIKPEPFAAVAASYEALWQSKR